MYSFVLLELSMVVTESALSKGGVFSGVGGCNFSPTLGHNRNLGVSSSKNRPLECNCHVQLERFVRAPSEPARGGTKGVLSVGRGVINPHNKNDWRVRAWVGNSQRNRTNPLSNAPFDFWKPTCTVSEETCLYTMISDICRRSIWRRHLGVTKRVYSVESVKYVHDWRTRKSKTISRHANRRASGTAKH
jgi:hypothetical protein